MGYPRDARRACYSGRAHEYDQALSRHTQGPLHAFVAGSVRWWAPQASRDARQQRELAGAQRSIARRGDNLMAPISLAGAEATMAVIVPRESGEGKPRRSIWDHAERWGGASPGGYVPLENKSYPFGARRLLVTET